MESVRPSMLEKALLAIKSNDHQGAYRDLVSCTETEGDNPVVWYHLGVALQGMKKWRAAAVAFARCNHLAPNDPQTLTNYAWNVHLSGRTEEALPLLERAIELAPDLALGHTDLAQVALMLGDRDRAIMEARKAVDLDQQNSIHKMSLAFALMMDGQYLEGFKYYTARFEFNMQEFLNYPYMRWNGDPVDTLFIVCEQGLGDSIQMMRYLPEVSKRCKKVVLYCQKELLTLFEAHVPDNFELHPMPKPLPNADVWCGMMSLPVALGNGNPEPPNYPYILPWKERKSRKGLHVGICWFGDPKHDLNHARSIPLSEFLTLAELPDVKIYSLQFGKASEDIAEIAAHGIITDLSPRCIGMMATADEIAKLDLVISIDTNTAHLSAAMGVPTWLLINRYGNDWRWGQEASETPWYPSMVVYRKKIGETWESLMDLVKHDLEGQKK